MKRNLLTRYVFILLFIVPFVNSASANIEIVDIFSDFTSSDVTILSDNDIPHGTAIFELFYEGRTVESHEIPFQLKAGVPVSKVIMWQKKPQYDYYSVNVSIYNGSHLFDRRSYPVSYGTVSMPSFHVVDFSPSNRGVQLLLRPFNPSAVDIKIELLEKNDVLYTETKEDVSLTANTEIEMIWPFLLTKDKTYVTRAKILTHRLYAQDLINTYIADFTANEDVEILQDDVEVDEYGVSATLRGKSQVPFDGAILVTAENRGTGETHTYRQTIEEILISGKEDTAGIVWDELAPGTYDIEILAVNQDNDPLDKYETVLRIPEEATVEETPQVKSTPGFTALTVLVFLIGILAVAVRMKRGG